jgi:hypothetical protein
VRILDNLKIKCNNTISSNVRGMGGGGGGAGRDCSLEPSFRRLKNKI